MKNEGCNIQGPLTTKSVPGSFHISAKSSRTVRQVSPDSQYSPIVLRLAYSGSHSGFVGCAEAKWQSELLLTIYASTTSRFSPLLLL